MEKYRVRITGPTIDSHTVISDEDDIAIVERVLDKVRKSIEPTTINETSPDVHPVKGQSDDK